jgi:PatG C-terminal
MQPAEATEQAEEWPPPLVDNTAAEASSGAVNPTPDDEARVAPQPAFVYAIGRVEPRFPSLAVEKELAQVVGRAESAGLTDRETLQRTLRDRDNRYLARRLCWVLLVESLETYVLAASDPADVDLLVNTVAAEPGADEIAVVVGRRGPIAPPEMCGGLAVPIVVFDQLWSFPRSALLEAIPRPEGAKDKRRFEQVAAELFDRVMHVADNAGAIDEHRALNYLAVRYPAIYERTAEAYAGNASLTSVDVRPSRLSGVRNIVDVVFSYTHRETDVTERFFVRVDVTEEFPFLVSRLAPFYETTP